MATFNQISSHDYKSSSISNLRARIFWMLWETDTELFSNALTFQWIKDAINELNIRDVFYFQEMEWKFTLVEWENTIALPDWFKSIHRLRTYTEDTDTYWSDLDFTRPELYSEGTWSFTIRNNTLLLPTATDTTVYVVDYKWIPEAPANELSFSLIPKQYDEAIINYVVAKAKMMEWQMSDAHTFMVMFENAIDRIKLNSVRRSMTPIESFGMTKIV